MHFFLQSSKKDNASEGAEDTCSSEKADAAGSSDEDEGALVIDEKNERGGNKRKAEESTEVTLLCPDLYIFGKLADKDQESNTFSYCEGQCSTVASSTVTSCKVTWKQ